MNITVKPSPLAGTVKAIPSKSHMHRLLIAEALSGHRANPGSDELNDDIRATLSCLRALFAGGTGAPILQCNESGSTLRFLLPVSMVLNDQAVFFMNGRLASRPILPLAEQMEDHGCRVVTDGSLMSAQGRLTAGEYELPGNVSTQFVSGLLFALPLLEGDSVIKLLTPLEARGYADMTVKVITDYGIRIEVTEDSYIVPGGQKYVSPYEDGVPIARIAYGDWSCSANFIAAGALTGGNVVCEGLSENSVQPDKSVSFLIDCIRMPGDVEINCEDVPDIVPVLAVVAALSEGKTVITNSERLKFKESDRLHAMASELSALGADITEMPDGFVIYGKERLTGGVTVEGYGDHRIVMALAVAALCCEKPVTIIGADNVRKSYPAFWDDFRALGGTAEEI